MIRLKFLGAARLVVAVIARDRGAGGRVPPPPSSASSPPSPPHRVVQLHPQLRTGSAARHLRLLRRSDLGPLQAERRAYRGQDGRRYPCF